VGTINPVADIVTRARSVGALTFIDAVHYAPHGLIDVAALGCDFLVCSAYKFFGPHVGVLWGRREPLASITPYKLRPSPNNLPGRWMTGTQNHEGIGGTLAAVEYLADVGRRVDPEAATRRAQLAAAFQAIVEYERSLAQRLIGGMGLFESLKVWGIADTTRLHERVPTVSVTHARRTPRELSAALAEQGLFTWAGNHYALPLTEALGLEPEGTLRIGIVHYNTAEEVDRLLAALAEIV
jgi:selenocysteine lyase/cysteine desulfurase